MPTVTAPGTGQLFEVTAAPGPDGGLVFLIRPAVGDGNLPINDADGARLPSNMVVRAADGTEVSVGDSANQAVRAFIAGGAAVVQSAITGAPFAIGIDGGVAQLFYNLNDGTANIARISDDQLIYTLGPPRANITQTTVPVVLTTTQESLLLPAIFGAESAYQDITHLDITTDYVEQQNPSIKVHLRDATNGTIRWTIAVGEKSGAAPPIYRKQTTPGNNWTVQISAAPPAGRSIFVNATAEIRLSVGG